MKRRTFIHNTALTALAVSAYSFVHPDGNQFVGDCETTTDILGPFYRPGSPVTHNLRRGKQEGILIRLSGIIKHNDCIRPVKNAKIEIWHCDENGKYDNDSDEYRYRGTSYSNEEGQYWFNTILPVPYDQGNGNFRPAHFHLMITADGYQPLVTQLYFAGDAHIRKDLQASSPKAKNRILEVKSLPGGEKKLIFNVSLSEKLLLETASINKLSGTYIQEDNGDELKISFAENRLCVNHGLFEQSFEYIGQNQFKSVPSDLSAIAAINFEFNSRGQAKIRLSYTDSNHQTRTIIASRAGAA